MKLVEINWSPSTRQLRQFGLLCLVALPAAGWLWGATEPQLWGLLGIAVALAVLGWTRPVFLRPLFIGLMLIAAPIGMIFGEFAMLLIFFGVFLPIGLVFRLMRRDALRLQMDRKKVSHWQPKSEPNDVVRYYQRY
jgi:hypothetical protein